ncbi:hypothetical protein COCCADRAFT_40807 [Bipolaris zeicola 26-R-13]|uniref:Peptidase M10 metallopeptidase domain-containing protein n=1 Tax=Cochliobolus carbonum (strain 26-R-13) TaxID=930089 RepID=W6XSU6_COCC2|nr:uncharacterized protein COCCADRAFT_40807 [Bipolaris zeicola 26-R-13]EUC28713.1 hypothetical protein COCCADRAFT_40807 [Bipolaris zeicola 26-R-13]
MADNKVIPVSELTKYPCDTQEETDPSLGPVPISNRAGTTSDNNPDEPDSIVVGYDAIVPRWDIRTTKGRVLQYFVQEDTFTSPEQARIAAKAFQEAADTWNELEPGVSISKTNNQDTAHFYLVYKPNPTVGPGRNTLARAFFPHEVDQDVIVFSRAFDADAVPILKNIFQHEIGHILGLRHEGPTKDPKPIMSCNFPPTMQDIDREQIAKFYKLRNGYKITGGPVTDVQPQIRRRNR